MKLIILGEDTKDTTKIFNGLTGNTDTLYTNALGMNSGRIKHRSFEIDFHMFTFISSIKPETQRDTFFKGNNCLILLIKEPIINPSDLNTLEDIGIDSHLFHRAIVNSKGTISSVIILQITDDLVINHEDIDRMRSRIQTIENQSQILDTRLIDNIHFLRLNISDASHLYLIKQTIITDMMLSQKISVDSRYSYCSICSGTETEWSNYLGFLLCSKCNIKDFNLLKAEALKRLIR